MVSPVSGNARFEPGRNVKVILWRSVSMGAADAMEHRLPSLADGDFERESFLIFVNAQSFPMK
jgi:hypothetical protein